jgi:hypothetical protein
LVTQHPWRQRIVWTLLIVWILAATSELGFRGIRRALSDSRDFAVVYASARTFAAGKNPYDSAALESSWLQANQGHPDDPNPLDLALYPPTTYLLLSPLALLDWNHARWVWLLINLIGVAVLVVTLTRYWPQKLPPWSAACVAAFILGFGPIHTGITKGQLAVVVTAILALAFVAQARHAVVPAAILIGLAASLKPQIAAPVIVLYLVQRQWNAITIVAGVTSLLLCMAAIRLSWAGVSSVHWVGSMLGNISLAAQPGGVYDSSPTNPLAFQLLNLAPLLRRLTANQAAIALLLAAVGIVVCYFLWKRAQSDSTAFATVCVLGLVLLAHRYYDAAVLVFVFAWALCWKKTAGWIAIAGCLVMAFPVPALLISSGHTRAPAALSQTLWDAVVIQQHSWVLLIVLAALTTALAQRPTGS